MSSRWISTRARACGHSSLTAAWAALTSELLPVPRAPHSSTLLAGSPAAKRRVLSSRMSRTRSIPRNSPISTRLTASTGSSQPRSACHTKASAASRSTGGGRRRGEALEGIGDAAQQRQQVGVGHRSLGEAPAAWRGRKGADAITGAAPREMRAIPDHCSLTRHRVPILLPRGRSFRRAGGRASRADAAHDLEARCRC